MIKYTIILVNMLAIVFARAFFAGDVEVKMTLMPDHLKKGDELTVTFSINKGSIAGVGHMKQELPAVFTNAVVVDAKGAEFKYLAEDNVVKFTWISLPPDQEFSVSYKVTVKADAPAGSVSLGGKFSYVLNNEKQTAMVAESSIMIEGETLATTTTPETTAVAPPETTAVTPVESETTATTTQATNTTQPETTATNTTTPPAEAKIAASVSAERTIVGSPEGGTEFTVEVNVKKDGLKGFARIQETLPPGLTAKSLENQGGTFSFVDQKLKIIWDNLPADENIKVSYRVAVADDISGGLTITGAFSYVENNDPQKTEIPASSFSVKAKTALANSNDGSNITPVPTPENSVKYKIQICALSKIQRGTSYFQSKFAISDKVNIEFNEGWKKYIVGKYNQYKDARDYRETIRSKGVDSPFVVAYNSGKRITVQEALMVSNQQWVR